MLRTRLYFLLVAIFLHADVLPRIASADEASDIANRIEDSLESLARLHVKWELTTSGGNSADLEVSLFSIHQLDEFAIAFDLGGSRYRKHSDDQGGQPATTQFWFDGGRTYQQEIRGNEVLNYIIMKELGDEGIRGQLEQANQYFEYIGSPFYDGKYIDIWRREAMKVEAKTSDPPKSGSFSIISCLRTGDYVKSGSSNFEGTACELWEYPGRDKLFLAPSLNYAIVKREWNWMDKSAVMMTYANSKFRKISENVWLPMKSQRNYFVPDRKEPLFSTTATVSDVKIGDEVKGSLFDPKPEFNSTVIDNTIVEGETVSYVYFDDPAAVQESIDFARQRVAQDRNNYLTYLAASIILLIAVVLLLVRWSRRK